MITGDLTYVGSRDAIASKKKINSMGIPGMDVCRSKLDLHTSNLDLHRSRLDVCRSKGKHTNLRYQKF